ncbi:hypothetical protein RRG08_059423 [Elysia crispata]|uniref:Uncharacterized protein n=1 Tax=Elysia crispata TaxID=231223 RepID=A0AAE1DT75_9GAST|nr:hypothetical protein RRG08_059423 [Elysia crispata]
MLHKKSKISPVFPGFYMVRLYVAQGELVPYSCAHRFLPDHWPVLMSAARRHERLVDKLGRQRHTATETNKNTRNQKL